MEVEKLNKIAVLQELRRETQDVDRLGSENELLQHTKENMMNGIVREGSCSTKFVDRLVNELKLEYVRITMSVVQ